MRILIPGGCGFVGTNLALYFLGRGDEVTCVDPLVRRGVELNASRIQQANGKVIVQDICDWRPPTPPDVILNCAAQSSAVRGMFSPAEDYHSNTSTVVACLEIARENSAGLVQWSTNKVYPAEEINKHNGVEGPNRYQVDWLCADLTLAGLPGSRSVYGASKLAAEVLIGEWSRAYEIPAIINRCSCLAGRYQLGCADQGWLAAWVLAHQIGFGLTYYGWKGKQVRDVLSVDDLCGLISKQIDKLSNHRGSIYNVGGGVENTLSLREATTYCARRSDKAVKPSTVSDSRWADHRVYVSDIQAVSEEFDWCPSRSPRMVLIDVWDWVSEDLPKLRSLYEKPPGE